MHAVRRTLIEVVGPVERSAVCFRHRLSEDASEEMRTRFNLALLQRILSREYFPEREWTYLVSPRIFRIRAEEPDGKRRDNVCRAQSDPHFLPRRTQVSRSAARCKTRVVSSWCRRDKPGLWLVQSLGTRNSSAILWATRFRLARRRAMTPALRHRRRIPSISSRSIHTLALLCGEAA
jgi:hypothetical protein